MPEIGDAKRGPLAAPTRKVWDQHFRIANEVQLRLDENPPAARPPAAAGVRVAQLGAQIEGRQRMGARGPGLRV